MWTWFWLRPDWVRAAAAVTSDLWPVLSFSSASLQPWAPVRAEEQQDTPPQTRSRQNQPDPGLLRTRSTGEPESRGQRSQVLLFCLPLLFFCSSRAQAPPPPPNQPIRGLLHLSLTCRQILPPSLDELYQEVSADGAPPPHKAPPLTASNQETPVEEKIFKTDEIKFKMKTFWVSRVLDLHPVSSRPGPESEPYSRSREDLQGIGYFADSCGHSLGWKDYKKFLLSVSLSYLSVYNNTAGSVYNLTFIWSFYNRW